MKMDHETRRRMGLRPAPMPEGEQGETHGRCGHWDTAYDQFGYCRDRLCRGDRLLKAYRDGKAFKLPDGSVVWQVE